MDSLTDSSYIFRYHRDMIAIHGSKGTAALGWRDQHSQAVRFDILSKIADLKGHSILDVGCGYGDLRIYLNDLYPDIVYTGIEQIPEMVDEAIERNEYFQNVSFISGNFISMNLPAADYVLASGSLNYRNSDPEFIFRIILKLYASCKLGLGFNLLSAIPPNGLLVAYDSNEIVNYCKTLSSNVVLKNDYTEEDFTIFMYR